MNDQEREVISKLIQLYRDLPCLWDVNTVTYRDTHQRNVAWEILVQKLKELEPEANVASVKKKIENLKTAYKREERKVKESRKCMGATIIEAQLHKPKLWYFDLMTFLDKKNDQQQKEADPHTSDDEFHEQSPLEIKRKGPSERVFERKRQKFVNANSESFESAPKRTNPFVAYVENQLENISTNQRYIAEKLISDVLFLAKIENLNFESKVETNSRLTFSSPSFSQLPSPQHSPSTQFIKSDPISSPLSSPPSVKVVSSKSASISPAPSQIHHQTPSTSSQLKKGKIKLSIVPQNGKRENQAPKTEETHSPALLPSQTKTAQVPSISQAQQSPRIIKLSIPPLSTCKVIQKTAGSTPKVTEGPAGTLLKGLLQQLQPK